MFLIGGCGGTAATISDQCIFDSSSFVTSAYVFALESFFLPSVLFVDKWYEILLFWALLGLLISFVLVKFWKRSTTGDKDINNY